MLSSQSREFNKFFCAGKFLVVAATKFMGFFAKIVFAKSSFSHFLAKFISAKMLKKLHFFARKETLVYHYIPRGFKFSLGLIYLRVNNYTYSGSQNTATCI